MENDDSNYPKQRESLTVNVEVKELSFFMAAIHNWNSAWAVASPRLTRMIKPMKEDHARPENDGLANTNVVP
jgi:hypothetical protein